MTVRGPAEHTVLEIAGELDFSSVDRVHEYISALPHRIVALDLSALEFIDGAGARMLDVVRQERYERHGERPRIEGPSTPVARTMQLVRNRLLSAAR